MEMTIEEIIAHCERQLSREPKGSIFYREHEAVKAYLIELQEFRKIGLEPEEIKEFRELCTDEVVELARILHKAMESGEVDHLRDLLQAEQDGRLVVLDEKTALSMYAGARAIENNKRLFGATYVYDVFGKHGGPKEISYYEASNHLRDVAEPVLDREEAEAALKGGEG